MTERDQHLERLDGGDFDVLIIGAGINGAVSAAILAAHGYRVAVVDRGDFASTTSQESSNLVWGGFKYLENYEFNLVRKLCKSRNRLMDAYPTNVVEKRFLAALGTSSPYAPPYAAAGAYAYWAIGGFKTSRPRHLTSPRIAELEPAIDVDRIRGGLEYVDAFLPDNDARFVFGFIRSAMDAGATAVNYVEATAAESSSRGWRAHLRDARTGDEFVATAGVIVNATGPFIDALNDSWGLQTRNQILFSKGIHLVVEQITDSGRVLAFFDDTGRLFYVIPMGDRSVIGTTDTRVEQPETMVSDEDRDFLLDQINQRLRLEDPLDRSSIISERCGVRPLVVQRDSGVGSKTDWTALSRKHAIEIDGTRRVVSIFGGKLTDCLNVGEEVLDACIELGLPSPSKRNRWYGEPGQGAREEFERRAATLNLHEMHAGSEPIVARLWRRYGHRAFVMLDQIRAEPDQARPAIDGTPVLGVEVEHMAEHEMVTTFDDFLRRRTDLSLTTRPEALRSSPQILDVANALFGDDARCRFLDHFANNAEDARPGEEAIQR